MNISLTNPFVKLALKWIQNYDKAAYWKMRGVVTDKNKKNLKIVKLWYLFRLKRIDALHNASFGTDYNGGAFFSTPPILPHGLNGIIVGHDCKIGRDVTIFHQVTIMHGGIVVGDNCLIGAGAKILPGVVIGNNVRIGANCVVVEDIPDNCTVVLPKARIIRRNV